MDFPWIERGPDVGKVLEVKDARSIRSGFRERRRDLVYRTREFTLSVRNVGEALPDHWKGQVVVVYQGNDRFRVLYALPVDRVVYVGTRADLSRPPAHDALERMALLAASPEARLMGAHDAIRYLLEHGRAVNGTEAGHWRRCQEMLGIPLTVRLASQIPPELSLQQALERYACSSPLEISVAQAHD